MVRRTMNAPKPLEREPKAFPPAAPGEQIEADCPFCTVDPSQVELANEHTIAFFDRYPISDGHTLVVPRRHVHSVFDLALGELDALWQLVAQARVALLGSHHPDGFTIGINDGAAAGQTVGHGHVHVVPRHAGDVPDPRGGIRWVIPSRAPYWTEHD
jgi:diadenosine tetraphosphate (Ap4A) HIT family hydrolase